MQNSHIPVMVKEVISFLPTNKKVNIIDATFGGGGYSRLILENFNVGKLIAIDRDPVAKIFAKELSSKYKNFSLINGCFGKIDELILNQKNNKRNDFDFIVFDLGVSSNQIDNPSRGFSFMSEGPLDMGMGINSQKVSDVVNNYSEGKLANIIFKYGEERQSRKIAKCHCQSRGIFNSTKNDSA